MWPYGGYPQATFDVRNLRAVSAALRRHKVEILNQSFVALRELPRGRATGRLSQRRR